MSDQAVAACITNIREAGKTTLPKVSVTLRQAWRRLANIDFLETDVFSRPYAVFAGRESGVAGSMADLRLELEGTLMSICDGVDLIGAALVETADEYEASDERAHEWLQRSIQK